VVDGERVERPRPRPVEPDRALGELELRDVQPRRVVLDRDDPLGVRVRERAEQDRVHDGERGDDRAEPEAKGEDDGRGERGQVRETAGRLTELEEPGVHGVRRGRVIGWTRERRRGPRRRGGRSPVGCDGPSERSGADPRGRVWSRIGAGRGRVNDHVGRCSTWSTYFPYESRKPNSQVTRTPWRQSLSPCAVGPARAGTTWAPG